MRVRKKCTGVGWGALRGRTGGLEDEALERRVIARRTRWEKVVESLLRSGRVVEVGGRATGVAKGVREAGNDGRSDKVRVTHFKRMCGAKLRVARAGEPHVRVLVGTRDGRGQREKLGVDVEMRKVVVATWYASHQFVCARYSYRVASVCRGGRMGACRALSRAADGAHLFILVKVVMVHMRVMVVMMMVMMMRTKVRCGACQVRNVVHIALVGKVLLKLRTLRLCDKEWARSL